MTKKKNEVTPKSNAGRPTKFTDSTLLKLETAFKAGATDVEACLFADIAPSNLYEYYKRNPEFQEQVRHWKQNPILKAKMTVYKNLDDVKTAQWLLERKDPEYKINTGINNNINVNQAVQKVFVTKEEIQNVDSHIDGIINED